MIATNLVAGVWGGSRGFARPTRRASGTRCASPRSRSSSRSRSARSCCSRAARRRAAFTTSTACCRSSSRCSPRAARAGAAERELVGPRLRVAARASASARSRWRSSGARPGSWPSRRWSSSAGLRAARGRDDGGLASTRRSASQRPVLAVVEEQRLARRRLELEHRSRCDHVVAALVHLAELAARARSARPRSSACRRAPTSRRRPTSRGCGSLVLNRRASVRLVGGEHVDPEPPRVLDRDQGARAEVEAGEHHRRLERQRGDGVGRRAGRPGRADAVTTVTPVGNRDIASRRASGSTWRHQLTGSTAGGGKYDAARVRPVLVITAAVAAALVLGACGSEGISVPKDDPTYRGAVLFSQRCAGCHTLTAGGDPGLGEPGRPRPGAEPGPAQGELDDVLFAIRNGGFSGGDHARRTSSPAARPRRSRPFVSKYAGTRRNRHRDTRRPRRE